MSPLPRDIESPQLRTHMLLREKGECGTPRSTRQESTGGPLDQSALADLISALQAESVDTTPPAEARKLLDVLALAAFEEQPVIVTALLDHGFSYDKTATGFFPPLSPHARAGLASELSLFSANQGTILRETACLFSRLGAGTSQDGRKQRSKSASSSVSARRSTLSRPQVCVRKCGWLSKQGAPQLLGEALFHRRWFEFDERREVLSYSELTAKEPQSITADGAAAGEASTLDPTQYSAMLGAPESEHYYGMSSGGNSSVLAMPPRPASLRQKGVIRTSSIRSVQWAAAAAAASTTPGMKDKGPSAAAVPADAVLTTVSVETAGRTYILRANTLEEAAGWVLGIRAAIHEQRERQLVAKTALSGLHVCIPSSRIITPCGGERGSTGAFPYNR